MPIATNPRILCPECQTPFDGREQERCGSCGWTLTQIRGIPVMLRKSESQRAEALAYRENYEALAQQNIAQSNIDRTYLRHQAKNIVRYLGSLQGSKVCELGVGQGFLLEELENDGAAEITAVDIAPSYLEGHLGKPRVRPILANAENLPFAEEFDFLISTDVMEHVVDLGSFLYCVNRALKPLGVACIRVPYMKTVVHHSHFLGYPHEYGHLRSFDRPVVSMLMETSGFRVDSMRLDGFFLGMPNQFFRRWPYTQRLYAKIHSALSKRLDHVSDVALWNSAFCRLFMMANELVVIATKTHKIQKREPRGYDLVSLESNGVGVRGARC
jgi:SAM-dependent methyltransferase